jgi:glucose dehydrogenase
VKNKLLIVAGVLVVAGAAAAGVLYAYWDQAVPLAGLAINYFRSWSAPPGTTTTELAAASEAAGAVAPSPPSAVPLPNATAGDWPSYNKTLTSERYSQLSQINAKNVSKLKVLCTYDTKQYTSFETGLIMVNGALIGTTEHDIFSLDPANCHENWRTHEDYKPASVLAVNRGAAYMDGLLFRGTEDGRVLAYVSLSEIKYERSDDAGRRGRASLRCSRGYELVASSAHLCSRTGVFGSDCNSSHSSAADGEDGAPL